MPTAYDDDLAYIHDVGFTEFAKSSAPGLLASLRSAEINSGLIVDLGCGSGIWLRHLIDAGYQGVGVDLSPSFVVMSQQRVPEAEIVHASYLEFEFPRCDVITALGEVLCYQFDERNGLDALCNLFKRIHAALRPGGMFIFDVAEPHRNRGLQKSFWEGDDWVTLVEFLHNESDRTLTRRIISFRHIADTYRRHEETHTLQLYDAAEIAQRLQTIGFHTRVVSSYGDYQLPAGITGIVAKKR